jgi:Xaa-Pro aminopeptidase
MEEQEARASGCVMVSTQEVGLDRIALAASNRFEARVEGLARLVEYFEIEGRVELAGRVDASMHHGVVAEVSRRFPGFAPVPPTGEGILIGARKTKDDHEVEAIREVGRKACRIMGEIFEWLGGCRVVDEDSLADSDGPVTIGRVKARLRLDLAGAGLTDRGETIFAQGADGGYPHSRGRSDEVLRVGRPIVFDLFPQEIGGGYFFDMTRTVSIGHGSPEYLEHHALVHRALEEAFATIAEGEPTRISQARVSTVFEEAGHPTRRSTPKTTVGYPHSLGHGIGLDVHEFPSLGLAESNQDTFESGAVFTVEPGLYYPEKGFGVRLEDVCWIDREGRLENLTDFPIEPVVELR